MEQRTTQHGHLKHKEPNGKIINHPTVAAIYRKSIANTCEISSPPSRLPPFHNFLSQKIRLPLEAITATHFASPLLHAPPFHPHSSRTKCTPASLSVLSSSSFYRTTLTQPSVQQRVVDCSIGASGASLVSLSTGQLLVF